MTPDESHPVRGVKRGHALALVRPLLFGGSVALIGNLFGDAFSDRDWTHVILAGVAGVLVMALYYLELFSNRRENRR